jgi:hypothetical protein
VTCAASGASLWLGCLVGLMLLGRRRRRAGP